VKHVVTGQDHIFGPWMAERTGGEWVVGRGRTVGLLHEIKGPIAACLYADCNGASVMMHCAGDGKDWLNREFLWYSFYYPFVQLGVSKIIAPVESTNLPCIKFIEHLGFSLEATLKDSCPQGNLLLYTLEKKNCKWLSLKEKQSVEAQSPNST